LKRETNVKFEVHGIDQIQENCKKISALTNEIKALIQEINETQIIITTSED